ncbi:MAG: M4 family metallopeptidase [Synergistaceae bacterium]|nr:M4 family metallopeptidase [Synergistaceae bacterium]
MTCRKFYAFMFVLCLLFLSLFTSGCGGGGGGGDSGQDNVDPDVPATSPDVPAPSPSPTSPDNPSPSPSPSSCTVDFSTNGGTGISSILVSRDSTIEQPEDPTREGYIFVGWYKDNGTFAEPFAFGEGGDTVTEDITLYAQWVEDNPAMFAVEDALASLTITYASSDNPSYVTQDVGLPPSSEGLAITWTSSNPGVISTSGNVSRPSGSNAEVTLTASATSGDFTAEKSFALTVIKKRTRTVEEAKAHEPVTPEDIELLNESDDNFEITYGDEVVRHIDGQFTDVKVETADDALDALQSVHEILGIDDPYTELEFFTTARDEYGAQYSFRQMHSSDNSGYAETLEVWGRTVMVSANASGDTDFLSSSFIETSRLNDVYTQYAQESAESAALRHYAGETGLEVVSADTKKIVYSLGEYEQEPVMAFIVRVTGQLGSGEPVDDTVIVSGQDLAIIRVMSNIRTWTTTDYGTDELGVNRKFPVTVGYMLFRKHLRDSGSPEVRIYSADADHPVSTSYNGRWRDRHQISAYTNMRTVLKWWKDTFNRNSLNNKGMTVKVITHDTSMNDNACWRPSLEMISIGNISDTSLYNMTRAIGLDTLTHETTHAVMYYSTGGIPYQNATGAIDDGYADIFGCLRDRDWRHGWRTAGNTQNPDEGITYFIDKTQCLRDAREDVTVNSISKVDWNSGTLDTIDDLYNMYKTVTPTRTGNDYNGCHFYCRLVTHAAYLMHQDYVGSRGLTWEELGDLWYKSMSMGLDATSDFHTVRRNVLRAAKQYGFTASEQQIIKDAFDKVGVTVPQGTLRARAVDGSTYTVIPGAVVQLINDTIPHLHDGARTDALGYASVSSDAGSYRVRVTASGYQVAEFRKYLAADKTENETVYLVKTGTASFDLAVRDSGGSAVSGATVNLCTGWYTLTGFRRATTDANGRCTFENIPAGYYTLLVSKTSANYSEHRTRVTIAPGGNSMTKTIFEDSELYYTACLYKMNRSYLDSHLKAHIWGGDNFHLSEENKTAYLSNGRQAARFWSYSSKDWEYIKFTNFYGSSFTYYVHWDNANVPDWSSNVYVYLYYKNKFLRTYTPPSNGGTGTYWKVFTLKNGTRNDVNEIVNAEPEAE